jgi:hypothetical protein
LLGTALQKYHIALSSIVVSCRAQRVLSVNGATVEDIPSRIRKFIDLERTELEQHIAALQLHYAFLDELSTRLDQQEAMLVSDAEGIRMTGKRLSPRLLKR